MPPGHAIPADAERLSSDMPGWHAYFYALFGATELTHLEHGNHPLPARTQKDRAMTKHSAVFSCRNIYMKMQLLDCQQLHQNGLFRIFEIVVGR